MSLASIALTLTPIVFITLLLIAPLVYLTGFLLLDLGEGLRYIYVKIPPDGEIYRVHHVGEHTIIALTGYDFGPLVNTLMLASIVSITSTTMAIVTSITSLTLRGPYRLLLGYIVPLIASLPTPLVSAYAVIHLFHRDSGLVNKVLGELLGVRISFEGIIGVAVYQVLCFYPLAHLILLSYMESIERSIIEAAYNLGGRGLTVASRILIPLSKPAIIVALSLIFVLSADDLSGPIAFSRYNSARNVLSYTAYYDFISEYGYTISVRAVVYVLILSVIAVMAFMIAWRHLRTYSYPVVSTAKIRVELGHATPILLVLTVTLMMSSVTPTALVIAYSLTEGWFGYETPKSITLDNYIAIISSGYYARAFVNTIAYATVALLIVLVVAYAAAHSSLRIRSSLSPIVEILTVLPIALPGIAIGIGYFTLFHDIFKWLPQLDPMMNPALYLILAYASRRLTHASRPLTASLQKIPASLEEQALNLGAGVLGVARTINIPLLLNPMIVGALLSSINMATEFSVSVVLAGGYGISASHPAPITPVILNALIYNPLSIHVASALIIATLIASILASIATVMVLVKLASGLGFKDLLLIVKGHSR